MTRKLPLCVAVWVSVMSSAECGPYIHVIEAAKHEVHCAAEVPVEYHNQFAKKPLDRTRQPLPLCGSHLASCPGSCVMLVFYILGSTQGAPASTDTFGVKFVKRS